MLDRVLISLLFAAAVASTASPALAADGQVVITQTKVLAGGVTAGDAAGFPATLSASGSYILGSDLAPGPNLDAIVVAAPDITIDLNGFKLSGGPAGGVNNARFGIFGRGDRLTVKNGTIGAFKSAGIQAPNRPYLVVENMRIINGRGLGINNEGGDSARIQNSTISTNLGGGITCGAGCHVEGNVVFKNGAHGVKIGTGMALGNTIIANGDLGLWSLISVGFGNNTIFDNNSGGDQVDGGRAQLVPNACRPGSC